jgi:hypothetical protein
MKCKPQGQVFQHSISSAPFLSSVCGSLPNGEQDGEWKMMLFAMLKDLTPFCYAR